MAGEIRNPRHPNLSMHATLFTICNQQRGTRPICDNVSFMPHHPAQLAIWIATWLLCGLVFVLILWRPRRIPEYVWAVAGAMLLVLLRLLPLGAAWAAVCSGTSVYLFLAGMMLLAELARNHGVFDWLAELAMDHARGSQTRLFVLVYGIGIVVTALLSNDATAVLLTPAVLAVVRRTKTSPLPYLFACALIANAASFVLPISNPANLVVFDGQLPVLGEWLRIFLVPSIGAIGMTFVVLWWHSRADLRPAMEDGVQPASLNAMGRRAGVGILLAAGALLATSAFGGPVGPAALAAGVLAMLFVAGRQGRVMAAALRAVSWSVIPLVAGLFVIVAALQGAGGLAISADALKTAAGWSHLAGWSAVAFGFGIAANAINNLPMGLIGAGAIHAAHGTRAMHAAVLLGIDLGPNLSVTGSLATILWLIALRREKIEVSGWRFLRVGVMVMPPALLMAVLALFLTQR
ncbi:MAG: arsenic transporter [Acidobacteriaceae bacterium]